MQTLLAEAIGTMLLILLGDGVVANVLLNRSKGQNGGWIVITAGWGVAVAMAVYAVGRISGAHLNPAVTVGLASIGSFAAGVATNLYERMRLGPAAVPLTPGVLLLVPGSIGFRSVTALLDENVVAGVDATFAMLLTAASLAAGILVANLVVPPRRVRRAPG